jgi:hypothetical protein
MSNITAGSIDGNYPSPGVNNSSQGFRDNFTAIRNNLTTAGEEISDLQSKVLVKSALSGTTMDNDMSGGRISNVETLGFRASNNTLSSNLSGTVTIDCTLGDVHIGKIDETAGINGAILLAFSKWAKAGTQSQVEVILTVQAGQTIGLPTNGDGTPPIGADTLEGYQLVSGNPRIKIPAGVTRVHYIFSTIDCGTTLEVMPVDRPRQTTQIKLGTPTSNKGVVGDQQGAIMIDTTNSYLYVCIKDYNGTDNIWKRVGLSSW